MNGSKSGSTSGINLEEFERRLRMAGAAASSVEDPLEELTRLVNTISAERTQDDKVVSLAQARLGRIEPQAPSMAPAAPAPAQPGDEPAAESISASESNAERDAAPFAQPSTPAFGLRPTLVESDARRHGSAAVAQAVEDAVGAALDLPMEPPAAPPPGRPRSWYLKVGGLGAMAAVMLAGAVTMKMGGVTGPKSPPLILAADSPSKVAPPSESAVQSPGDTGALLTKDSTSPTPVKLVNNEEQPVDIGAKVAGSPVAPTSDTPVVEPSEGYGSPVPAVSPPTGGLRIKTVSVRPDGSLIAVDSTSAPAATTPAPPPPAPVARKSDAANAANPQPATPTLDLPPAKPAAKSAARVPIARTDTTVPADAVGAPLASRP